MAVSKQDNVSLLLLCHVHNLLQETAVKACQIAACKMQAFLPRHSVSLIPVLRSFKIEGSHKGGHGACWTILSATVCRAQGKSCSGCNHACSRSIRGLYLARRVATNVCDQYSPASKLFDPCDRIGIG